MQEDGATCIVCGYPVSTVSWYRPRAGGRRKTLLVCDEDCKKQWFSIPENRCFEDAPYRQGYDVFVPLHVRMNEK